MGFSAYTLENGLVALEAEADKVYLCSAEPANYSDATSGVALGNKNFGAGNVLGDPDSGSGEGVAVLSVAVTDGTVTANGTATHWAIVDSAASRLLADGVITARPLQTPGWFTLTSFTMLWPGLGGAWWLSASAIDLDFQNDRYYNGIPLDPLVASTVLMLHGDGVDASTNISDSTGQHFITVGNGIPEIDTAQSKFGGASIFISGASGWLIPSPDIDIGTGDFTIDFWLRPGTTTPGTNLIEFGGVARLWIWSGDQNIYLTHDVGGNRITGTTAVNTVAWYHVALTRSGGSTRLFLNGTQIGSTYSPDTFDYQNISVGASTSGVVNAWLDEIRVVVGSAAWTTTFTPPTMPYNVGVGPYDLLSCSRASVGYAQTAAGTLTLFAANQLRITDKGLLLENVNTNVVLWNRDLTNAAWTASNITAVKDQTGPDGVASSASKITASAGNGTILQAITLGSSIRSQSAWVKRITGSGTVNMTMDNGSTWTAITVTAGWTLAEIPTQTLANPTVGFRIVTNGDAIAVDFVQNEDSYFASSPIPTTTVAAARAGDVIPFIGGLKSALLNTQASAVLNMKANYPSHPPGGYPRVIVASGVGALYVYGGDTTVAFNVPPPDLLKTHGGSFMNGVKVGFSYDGSGRSLTGNGAACATDAVTGADFSGGIYFQYTANYEYFYHRRLTVWTSRLADADLQSFTDPAGPDPTDYAVDLDFQTGIYTVNARPQFYLSCSRASVGYAQTAAGTLTKFAANQLRITDQGLLVEDARENVVLWNRDLTNAAWTASNITAVKDQTGPDGVANSASKITASAGNGTILQAITLASSARYQSAWVKRITGSGTINMTMDNGSTWTAITVTAGWTSVEIPTQTLANPTVGFRIVTNGDAIAVDFVQNEGGIFASSPIPTTTAAVTRASDVDAFIGALLDVGNAPQGTFVIDVKHELISTWPAFYSRIITNYPSNSIPLYVEGGVDGYINSNDNTPVGLSKSFSGSFITGAKVGVAWDVSGRSLTGAGATPASDANGNMAGAGKLMGTANSEFWYYRRITAWTTRLADVTLQGFTAP